MNQRDVHEPVVEFVDPLPRQNNGSLLNLFSSPYFTLEMGMMYLYDKKNLSGVHDFLVNKFYTYQDHEIDFYVPQLCYLLIKYRSPILEKFLLDKCIHNIPLFLKIYWCLEAYGQAEKKQKKGFEAVEAIIKKTELAMVNGGPTKNLLSSPEKMPRLSDESHVDRTEMMKAEFHRRKAKADYLAFTLKFINIITAVSLKLKEVKPTERKLQLKLYVKRINRWLLGIRKKHAIERDEYFRRLFYGIHVPFSSETKDNSTMIVNILEDEVTCFNTKKRAPYRIVVETVDMDEILTMPAKSRDRSHSSRASRQIDLTMNQSELDSSVEEDAFQDLIEEQEKNKTKGDTQVLDLLVDNEKYRGLGDLERLVKEEEMKMMEGGMVEPANLLQMDFLNQNSSLDEKEERGSPTNEGEKKNSNAPLTQKRKSFAADGKIDNLPHRSSSYEDLDNKGRIEYMEALHDDLPQSMKHRMDGAINELKEEALEEYVASHEELKVVDEPKKEETQIMGWGPWDELWEHKQWLIREKSIFGHYKSYKLRCIIVKANDDLRQELITMQIMIKMTNVWKEAGLNLRVRTYDILVTSEDSGILEFVPDTCSIDGLKKKYPGKSLLSIFQGIYGYDFGEAQKNFMDSLASYCLICYFLQIKDRHNGNILLDAYGHIVHIDFGFILCTSPGSINFESAPFKLTNEYVELMGGPHSNTFTYFKLQMTKGFMELRKHVGSLVYFLQTMMEGSDLACFENFNLQEWRDRFKEQSTDTEALEHVSRLVDLSQDNWRTVQYDNFQKYTNGIMP